MSTKLTEKIVRDLTPPEKGNRILYDTEVKGFGIRITKADAKAFVLNYRINGRERRATIGAYPDWSVSTARKEAMRLKRNVDLGEDPVGDREAERRAATIADMCRRYLDEHAIKNRASSQRNSRALIKNNILPKIGKRKVADIRHADVDALHRSLSATPYQANRLIALLSKMFNLAIKWEWIDKNPATGIEKYDEAKRERYLRTDEYVRLAAALEEYPDKRVTNAIRLLLLTGARKSEVFKATWDQFDLKTGIWLKPRTGTKQNKDHRVPLSDEALELLQGMRDGAVSDYLFPGNRAGEPLTEIKKAWKIICENASLDDLRVHDLRHSYASVLASSGLSLPIIGELLGHSQPQTTARYAHLLDEPLREATDFVGRYYRDLRDSPKVVTLDKRRG